MVNLTFNDDTQVEIINFLKTTEKMLSDVTSELSGKPKQAKIYAMSDLGIAIAVDRMLGGFFTGTCTLWDCDVPFVPVDTTLNVCGVAIYKLKEKISPELFYELAHDRFDNDNTYKWNMTRGNHFIGMAYSDGEYGFEEGYYILVHASAREYMGGNMEEGLMPQKGNWYYDHIKTHVDKETGRFLRYLDGEYAERFWEIAHNLEIYNEKRNDYFIEKTYGKYIDKKVMSIQHYGMPTRNSVCVGCNWQGGMYPLLTSPGEDIYMINPEESGVTEFEHDGKKFKISPHGLGSKIITEDTSIKFTSDSLIFGGREYKANELLNIGQDIRIRGTSEGDKSTEEYVNDVLKRCPGKICGKLHQICAENKNGFKIYEQV